METARWILALGVAAGAGLGAGCAVGALAAEGRAPRGRGRRRRGAAEHFAGASGGSGSGSGGSGAGSSGSGAGASGAGADVPASYPQLTAGLASGAYRPVATPTPGHPRDVATNNVNIVVDLGGGAPGYLDADLPDEWGASSGSGGGGAAVLAARAPGGTVFQLDFQPSTLTYSVRAADLFGNAGERVLGPALGSDGSPVPGGALLALPAPSAGGAAIVPGALGTSLAVFYIPSKTAGAAPAYGLASADFTVFAALGPAPSEPGAPVPLVMSSQLSDAVSMSFVPVGGVAAAAGTAAATAGGAQAPPPLPSCTACPDNWTPAQPSPGTYTCLAPGDYAGKCGRTSNFMGYTATQAKNWAQECGASWTNPCAIVSCQTCPDGWSSVGTDWTGLTTCKAPGDYKGSCAKQSKFAGYSPAKARAWAQECGATWTNPCDMSSDPT